MLAAIFGHCHACNIYLWPYRISEEFKMYVAWLSLILYRSSDGLMLVAPAPYHGFRGCFVIAANNSMRIDFISLTLLETGESNPESDLVVIEILHSVVMALMAISAYRACLCLFINLNIHLFIHKLYRQHRGWHSALPCYLSGW